LAAATLVSCLYCALVSFETTPLGLLGGALSVPSVLLFLLLERTPSGRWGRLLGFFVPAILIVGGSLLQIQSIRAQREALSDGGDGMLIYILQTYGLGLGAAFLALLWRGRRAEVDSRTTRATARVESSS
jgi:hypothetical protein